MDITLYHYDFESDNQNVLLFDDKAQRDNYFASQSDKVSIQNINFLANDIMQTKVFVRVDDLSLFTLLNYNYAIVTNSTGETTQNPLFFYILSSRQDSGGDIEISLKCDIGNTYFYDVDMTKWQAIIQRAHLNRFFENSSEYIYNFKKTSDLFERENVKNVAKRTTEMLPLYAVVDKQKKYSESELNKWLKDNIICYKYYFLSANHKYQFRDIIHGNTPQNDYLSQLQYWGENYNLIDSNFTIICEPVYKYNVYGESKKIYYRDSNNIDYEIGGTSSLAMRDFLSSNDNFANIQSIKYSQLPPFRCQFYSFLETPAYTIENGNLIITKDAGGLWLLNDIHLIRGLSNNAFVMHCEYQFLDEIEFYIDDENNTSFLKKWNFTKNEIKTTNNLEPKIKNEDFSTYKLLIGGQQYEMPISKTSAMPTFLYKEILAPDITKAVLVYNPTSANNINNFGTNNVMSEYTKKDFSGFVLTIDLSIWYPQTKLDDYLANNKNLAQIMNNNQIMSIFGNMIGNTANVGNVAMDDMANMPMAIVNTAKSTAGTIANAFYQRDNLNLTIDNMANSPAKTSAVNSNALLIMYENNLKFYIEILEPLEFEQNILIDYFKQFGYTYNRLSTISEYLKTRKYYNYLQAQIFEIPEKLGNNVKEEIKKMFANGIRFWHYDTYTGVDFTQNNYERFLDE